MTRNFWCLIILAFLMLLGTSHPVKSQDAFFEDSSDGLSVDDEFDLFLLQNPVTAEEILKTASISMRLGRMERCKQYIRQLLELKPDDKTLLGLQKHVSDINVLRMARTEELQPESTQLLKMIQGAMERYKNDPARIEDILHLLEGTPEERQLAIFRLKTVGPPAVPFIVSRIIKDDSQEKRALYTQALTLMGRHAISPMIAALQSPNEAVRVTAIEVLRFLQAKRRAAPRMLWLAFGPDIEAGTQQLARRTLHEWNVLSNHESDDAKRSAAATTLSKQSLEHFRKTSDFNAQQTEADIWLWDHSANTVVKHLKSQAEASQILGTIQSHQALQLDPNNRWYQSILLGFVLAGEHKQTSTDFKPENQESAHNLALSLGPELVSKTLAVSLQYQNNAAAYATISVLKELGNAQLLHRPNAPILDALNYHDSAVQFAAVETILSFEPQEPFRYSSRIVPILARKVTAPQNRTAIVVGANLTSNLETRDLFSELRFDTISTATGRAGFKYAANNREVDLIVLRENTVHWPMSQTVANLRADSRTSSIPIVIYGSLDLRERVELLQQQYDAIEYVQTTVESRTMREAVDRLMHARNAQSPLTETERQQQQERSAYWLAQLAQLSDNKMYDLNQAEKPLIMAMDNEQVIGNALITLSSISTKNAQSTIAQYVLSEKTDERVRAEAIEQLKKHISRFGLLIDDKEVLLLKQLRQERVSSRIAPGLSAVMGLLRPDSIRSGRVLDNFAKRNQLQIAR